LARWWGEERRRGEEEKRRRGEEEKRRRGEEELVGHAAMIFQSKLV
jgi:hypothetical protein